MLKVSWAYTLRKEELMTYLNEAGMDSTGNVEEMRKRYAGYLGTTHEPEELQKLLQLQEKHEQSTSDGKMQTPLKIPKVVIHTVDNHENNGYQTPLGGLPINNGASATILAPNGSGPDLKSSADQVRKWGVKFNGDTDPLEFMERIEELVRMYSVHRDTMPIMMPEVLVGKALVWYRNNNPQWDTWSSFRSDFLKFFLPPRYFERLEDDIRKRHQKSRETFKNYVLSLQNLMRHSSYTPTQKLERIFQNALPEYRWYIKRKDFATLEDLLELAADLESIPTTSQPAREPHRLVSPGQSNEISSDTRINYITACRRCGQDGHQYGQCRNDAILFCWECGRRNIRTIDCCRRRSGNESRARTERGVTGPSQETPRN